MLLMGVDTFRESISAPVNADAAKLMTIALKQATSSLSSFLHTKFDRVTNKTEYFHCTSADIYHEMNPLPVILERGFLASEPSVIKFAGSFANLSTVEAYVGDKVVNTERGTLHILRPVYPDQFISITYTAGFQTTPSEFGDVYTGVPEWLEDIVVRMALELYQSLRTWSADKPLPMPTFSKTTMAILEPHTRGMSGYLRGMNA